jgi:hypothetical protein
MTANYVLLEKITVGSAGASSVTFNSIPQTGYTDLVLKVSSRDNWSNPYRDLVIGFNGVTTNLSSKRLMTINSGTPASYSNTSGIWMHEDSATATANTFANIEYYIPNYTSSNYKSVSVDGVTEDNSVNTIMTLTAGLWSSTAAITSITLSVNDVGYSFSQYSTFYLYGVAKLGTTPAIVPYATGGDTIMTDGTYWYHAFKSSGTFTPTKGLSCDVLVVAGGGGGGTRGAGGAGGYRSTTALSLATATSVTVGAGGAVNANGSDSVFSITSTGGGKGATSTNAGNGGSGGGGYDDSVTNWLAGSGNTPSTSPSQGNNGGAGSGPSRYGGGGGGGASAAGGAAVGGAGGVGGDGSNAHSSWLSVVGMGVSGYLAGGGGGGNDTGGAGGAGGGGKGADGGTDTAVAGTANTGGGGGGGRSGAGVAKAGGSGLVVIRYAV